MQSRERERILIVEDDRTALATLELLFDEDWEVLTASSAVEARAILDETEVSVIVADQRMPGGSGIALFAWCLDHCPDATRILLTGYADLSSVVDAINRGQIWHYVKKPWQDAELRNVVRRAAEYRAKAIDLRRSEQRYREFFKYVPAAVFLADSEGIIREANPFFAKALGYASPDELLGRRYHEFYVDAFSEEHRRFAHEMQEKGLIESCPIRARARDGSEVALMLNLAMRTSPDRGVVFEGWAMDQTQLEKLRSRLDKQGWGAVMAALTPLYVHDLANLAQLLLFDAERANITSDPVELDDLLADLLYGARGVAELLRGLKQESSLKERGPFEAGDALRRVARTLGRRHPEVRVHVDVEAGLPVVMAASLAVDRAIVNLCTNAGQAMNGRGNLWLRARCVQVETGATAPDEALAAGSYVRIEVEDDGPGMPAHELQERMTAYVSTKASGMGLGLYSVQAIAEAHGGALTLDSAPGKGTRFALYLAFEDLEDEDTETTGEILHPGGSVLIVESEAMVRYNAVRLLESYGYRVLAADGPQVAYQRAETASRIDLAIVDLDMHDLCRETLFESLRTHHPDVPVLFIGINLPCEEARQGVRCLEKPFDVSVFERAVASMVRPGRTDA